MVNVVMKVWQNLVPNAAQRVGLVMLAIFAYLTFVNLDYAPFWDDEAIVPVMARNVLRFGAPLADDGRNILSYYNGADIADDLTYRYPRLGIYMQATMFSVFGEGEIQARALCALFAVATMVFFADVLRREFPNRTGFVVLTLAFACFSPVMISYARSATYNAPILFFNMLLFWSYLRFCERPRVVFTLLIALAALAGFHLHYLSNLVFIAAFCVFHLLFRRACFNRRAWWLAIAVAMPYVLNVAWFYFTEYSPDAYASRNEAFSLTATVKLLSLYLAGLNQNGILTWTVVLWFVGYFGYKLFVPWRRVNAKKRTDKRRRQRKRNRNNTGKSSRWRTLIEDRVFHYCVFVIVFTAIIALVSPHPSTNSWADVRYMSMIVPFAAPVSAAMVWWAWQYLRPVGVVLGAVLLLSDLSGWPFLKHRIYGDQPRWTLPALVVEYHRVYPGPMRAAMAYLREHANQDDVVFSPIYLSSSRLVYYLSDKILMCNLLYDENLPDALQTEGREYLFKQNVFSGVVNPDWLLYFGGAPSADFIFIREGGPRYALAAQIPGAFFAPTTLQRPEPVWHDSFPPQNADVTNSIRIYRIERSSRE